MTQGVAGQRDFYEGCSMGELIVRAIRRGGDRPALVLDDQVITYREYGEMLSRCIQALEARGIRKGDAIGTLSSNRPEALLTTALAYLMGLRITWMHPLASEDDHAYLIEDSGVKTLFVDPETFAARAKSLKRRVPGLQTLYGFGPNDFGEDIMAAARGYTPAPLEPKAGPDDICVLIYTGGTTGRPKGVVHTHRVHVAMVMAELAEWDWPEEVRFLAMTPITHAAGAMVLAVMMRSGTFVMNKGFDAEKFFALVAKHRITSTFLVPTMIYVLLDHPGIRSAQLDSLKLIIYGAAPMAPARLVEGIRVFGPVFMQLYAQSEAPNTVTVLRKIDHDPVNHPERLASCGSPIGGIQVRLMDDDGREVPVGDVGEICVRGPLVMVGYWNQPEETARAMRHGWLYTGDLARADSDGYL